MSGILIATLAGLLTPQSAPPASAQVPYEAPAVRPFEPGSDFGRDMAEGDNGTPPHRRPLTEPVTVDRYARSYEFTPTDLEAAYEQGVASAEIRTDQTAGPLDGMWSVRDPSGAVLFELVLMDSGAGPVEGGWRSGARAGGATAEGGVLTLEGAGSIALERGGGGWRGRLTLDGRTRPVTLSRPD